MQVTSTVAVITGAASGMGAATARHLAHLGAKVALLDRDVDAAQSLAKELHGLAIRCDVTQEHDVELAMEQIIASVGTPRICVNCAGIAPGKLVVNREHQPMPLADFSQVIQVNLVGTFNVMRVAAAAMSKLEPVGESNERGVIINTASIAAFEGQIGQTAYSASKGGVVGMTLPAARELARHAIRVMTIAPGLIATPMLNGMSDKVRENLLASTVFPARLGESEEFAHLVAHIIDNAMLNGSVIRLDGAVRLA